MRLCLVIPPLTQLNTPYPGTAYLARFLRGQGIPCSQRDLGLELALKLLSREGLAAVFDAVAAKADAGEELPEPAWRALALRRQHEAGVDAAVRLLQGRDRTLAARILDTPLLPRGPRLSAVDLSAFGRMGAEDAARHVATRYIEDLVDLVTATLDPGFSLSSYQHHLACGAVSFDPIAERLAQTGLIDGWLDALADSIDADAVGLSVPFPGALYGALRIGKRLKSRGITAWMGGGYVSTELREVDEPRLWSCVDALVYDDGEGPLRALIERSQGGPDQRHRTRTREGLHDNPAPRPAFTAAAWYGDLPLQSYLQLVDSLNPAHRLWSDGRWNKITLAHGCYWKRCAFCDVTLDYIARYEPARIEQLVEAMAETAAETGTSGFHLVDEAAPPRLMRDLALALLARGETFSWWGNIRFEKAFSPDLCRLLAASGLIAVTGGLEVASDRLLALMDKGVTVEQAAAAAHAFRQAGVMVHAYLMYGFPTQTAQETLDAMEVVRQMFAEDVLSSAFWHRFVLTRHSRIYADPARYQVRIPPPAPSFAANDLAHTDPVGADPDRFDEPLVQALAAWMRGEELDKPVASWFPGRMPRPAEPADRIRRSLPKAPPPLRPADRLIWLGGDPLEVDRGLLLPHADGDLHLTGRSEDLEWLAELLDAARPAADPVTFGEARAAFPGDWDRFEKRWRQVRAAGLIGV